MTEHVVSLTDYDWQSVEYMAGRFGVKPDEVVHLALSNLLDLVTKEGGDLSKSQVLKRFQAQQRAHVTTFEPPEFHQGAAPVFGAKLPPNQ